MKKWQLFIKDYVLGDLPKTTKCQCTTQCNQCGNQYSVSAANLKRNLEKNGKVVCTQCVLSNRARSKKEWRELIRPYYPDVETIVDQKENINYTCPNCERIINIKVLTLVRGVKERNSNGFCRSCIQKTSKVSEAISKSQKGKRLSSSHKRKISEKTSLAMKEVWQNKREMYIDSFRLSWKELVKEAKRFNFVLIDRETEDYVLKCMQCNKETRRRPNKFYKICGFCNPSTSTAEEQIRRFIESFDIETERLKEGLEIDIYIASKKLGIEHHGLYWHSELFKNNKYHYNKYLWAKEKGINLIQIFEDEWANKNIQVTGYIQSKLGIGDKIYARKCRLEKLSIHLAREFLNKYHIQGSVKAIAHFGLYFEQDLVAVMSLSRHHRSSNKAILSRLCFKKGIQVIGGSFKLFKALIEEAENLGYRSLKTWSDNRYSNGNIYKRLGFELDGELPPDYSYVKSGKRYSKQSLKKTPEERVTGKTERELRLEQGYHRIWDCGKKRWIYHIEKEQE